MDGGDGTLAMMRDPCVLVVAASDSSGGAGIMRDAATVASFGMRTAVAVTAVTVQTHAAVLSVEPVAPTPVAEQMEAAITANTVRAVKIGLLPSVEVVAAVASVLRRNAGIPVVLDPVLVASSGGALTGADTTAVLIGELLPLVSLVTPNLGELATLSGESTGSGDEDIFRQGGTLLKHGAGAVLAKGGHGSGASAIDYLLRPDMPPLPLGAPRLEGTMRGTGCMLSSAIAAGLAREHTLERSVRQAKKFVHARLVDHMQQQGRHPAAPGGVRS